MAYRITSEMQARRILAELERRRKAASPPDIQFHDPNFPEQAKFILDDSPLQAGLCPRRAGKSVGAARKLVRTAVLKPRSMNIYLATIKAQARVIMCHEAMPSVLAQLGFTESPKSSGLQYKEYFFNKSRLEYHFWNKSVVWISGADKDAHQIHKYLGGKLGGVIIDEAGSFKQDLRQMVYEMLEPALMDWRGWLALIGTPTDLIYSLFFDVTHPEVAKRVLGWNVHEWSSLDNPYMREEIEEKIEAIRARNPGVVLEDLPWFKRMYLGQWATEDTNLCYKFQRGVNETDSLPSNRRYTYVLGIDLGWDDPTAFVLLAFNMYDKVCYVVKAEAHSKMDFTDVAEKIKQYQDDYPIYAMVVDNASKQGVQEMVQRHNLALEPAEKSGKSDFIELMNHEWRQGLIKVLPDAEPLAVEYSGLVWDIEELKKRRVKVEHPACPNHMADAALYGWRYALNYLSRPQDEPQEKSEEEKMFEAAIKFEQKQRSDEPEFTGWDDNGDFSALGY